MSKFKEFIRRVSSILNLKTTLDGLGIKSAVSSVMAAEISTWSAMYTNRKGLALPAAIASELARPVTLELKSEITGSVRADFLNSQYRKVIDDIRTTCEYACATGGLMFKPYVWGDSIAVDYVRAENFIPTKFDISGNITAVAFLSRIYKGDRIFTRIEYHDYNADTYVIKNMAFVSSSKDIIGRKIPLSSVPEWERLQPSVTITKAYAPLYSYFKMPMANPADPESPLGVSVYARAESLMDDAQKQYERLLWEFESGERTLYVSDAAVTRDKTGARIIPDKRLYRLLDYDSDNFFKEWTPTLREAELVAGLDDILRKIEFNTGLAYGTLSNVQTTDKTAEEIKASKQRSYSTVSEIQKSLKTALSGLVRSMNVLCDLYELAPPGEYSVSTDFDDSIMTDRKAEFEEKMRLLSAGIIKPWEMRSWYCGEDEKTARERVMTEPFEDEE